jgi:hypothetical protein
MSLIPFGFWAASGAAASAYDLLETTTLTSSASSVTFSGLGTYTDYKDLQVRLTARSSKADFQDDLAITFNGVTANYSRHSMINNSSAINQSFISVGFNLFAANETASAFGFAIVDLLDFASTNKTQVLRIMSGGMGGTQLNQAQFGSGMNNSTSAITSIAFGSTSASSLTTGSKFSLYGIRGQ